MFVIQVFVTDELAAFFSRLFDNLFVLAFLPRALYPVSSAWLRYLCSVRFWKARLPADRIVLTSIDVQ